MSLWFCNVQFLRHHSSQFQIRQAFHIHGHNRQSSHRRLWRRLLRVLLLFQEQIQGAKNASIARFDGLGCYQIRSEISGFPERLSRAAFRGDFQNLPASGPAPGKRADKRPLQTGPGAPQKMGSACQPRAAASAPPRPHENATPKRPL